MLSFDIYCCLWLWSDFSETEFHLECNMIEWDDGNEEMMVVMITEYVTSVASIHYSIRICCFRMSCWAMYVIQIRKGKKKRNKPGHFETIRLYMLVLLPFFSACTVFVIHYVLFVFVNHRLNIIPLSRFVSSHMGILIIVNTVHC